MVGGQLNKKWNFNHFQFHFAFGWKQVLINFLMCLRR